MFMAYMGILDEKVELKRIEKKSTEFTICDKCLKVRFCRNS